MVRLELEKDEAPIVVTLIEPAAIDMRRSLYTSAAKRPKTMATALGIAALGV